MVSQMNRSEWVAELTRQIATATEALKAAQSDGMRRVAKTQLNTARRDLRTVLQTGATFR